MNTCPYCRLNMSDVADATAHINGCEYFTQPLINRVMTRMIAGEASATELQQIVAIQMRQIQGLMTDRLKTDAEMREVRAELVRIRKNRGTARVDVQSIMREMSIPSTSFMGWCNRWTISRADLDRVEKDGLLLAFKAHLARALLPTSEVDWALPICAVGETRKVYLYDTAAWRALVDNDISIMFRHFKRLMEKERCRWEEENQEYLYTTDDGMEKCANMWRVFGYDVPKREMKALADFMYRKCKA